VNQLAPITASYAPALTAAAGPRASYRFLEFFAAKIRNPHTRRAYARAFRGGAEARARGMIEIMHHRDVTFRVLGDSREETSQWNCRKRQTNTVALARRGITYFIHGLHH